MQSIRNRILLAREETVYGTDSVPVVATHAIDATNVSINFTGETLARDLLRNTISPLSPVMGKRWVEVNFDVELKGGGTKGTACKIGDLLEACSFAETASAGSSVTYLPSTLNQKSVTIYLYNNDNASAVLQRITGAMGNVSMKFTAGQVAVLSFAFKGIYNLPTDVANPAAPTYETTIPPIVESCVFTLNSSALLIAQELSLDIGNEVSMRDDIGSVSGLKGFMIPNRQGKGSFNPEALLVANYGFWADWVAATQRALSIVIGTMAGNKITITAPKVTLDSLSQGERERILTYEIPFSLGQNVGNDEISIKFE